MNQSKRDYDAELQELLKTAERNGSLIELTTGLMESTKIPVPTIRVVVSPESTGENNANA